MKAYIYTLACPTTNNVVYVGETQHPLLRFNMHLGQQQTISVVRDWISYLKEIKLTPLMNVIDTVQDTEADYWERFYIHLFRSWGFDLLNFTTHSTFNPHYNKAIKPQKLAIVEKYRAIYNALQRR